MDEIAMISFGYFEKQLLDAVTMRTEQAFSARISWKEGFLDLGDYYDPSRRQYDGNRILKVIDERFGVSKGKTIGLLSIDLFIPILTFIYGQAFLNGRSCIASNYRLSNERYGLLPDETLMHNRFIKEIIHELGHTYGLIHCSHPDCVMRSSTYVEDIDQKGEDFCPNCKSNLIHFPE
ncbi:MAG: archaemetzincin family Zn-dependent metalloprotease [Bacteroidales bacterium]|nr:archaemetzincin family Zn-dependent metalloprotease [Bacteroidales bacterium]